MADDDAMVDCPACDGTGSLPSGRQCPYCDGDGEVTPDEAEDIEQGALRPGTEPEARVKASEVLQFDWSKFDAARKAGKLVTEFGKGKKEDFKPGDAVHVEADPVDQAGKVIGPSKLNPGLLSVALKDGTEDIHPKHMVHDPTSYSETSPEDVIAKTKRSEKVKVKKLAEDGLDDCPACRATGKIGGRTCPLCKGEKKIDAAKAARVKKGIFSEPVDEFGAGRPGDFHPGEAVAFRTGRGTVVGPDTGTRGRVLVARENGAPSSFHPGELVHFTEPADAPLRPPAAPPHPAPAKEGADPLRFAVWSTAYINDLPDSSFAWIEPGGQKDSEGKTTPRSLRHYPYKDANGKVDLPHLRNALSRHAQGQTVTMPASGRAKLEAAAKEAEIGERTAAAEPHRFAALTPETRAGLQSDDFAYTDDNGNGHLPIHDAPHIRNAAARFTQHQFPDAGTKAQAARKIKRRAKQVGVEIADDSPVSQAANMSEPLVVALGATPVTARSFKEGLPLPFLKVGEHHFADYGDVNIDDEKLDQVVSNFKRNVRRQDLPIINEEHIPTHYDENGPVMGPGAVGYLRDMYRDGDTVYVVPDWNKAGERLMQEDRYRGTSPELMLNWTDPETLESHGLTAVGLALTNRPRMKNLAVQGRPLDGELAATEHPCILAFAEPFAADVHNDKALTGLSIAYAYPDRKRLPLHSAEAVKGATARFMGVEAPEGERDAAWTRIREAANEHGVTVPESWRALKATEVAHLLMQETLPGSAQDIADDIRQGAKPPCMYQPPFDRCHGYTRASENDDGGVDVCAMASQGCNGYTAITATSNGATPLSGQPAPPMGWYAENAHDQTSKEEQMEQDPATASDFAEMQTMYRAMEQRLELAERQAQNARDELDRMETARKLSEAQNRIDHLVRTGRITPAVVEKMSPQLPRFAEDSAFLDVLEALPANSAVNMTEVGSSAIRPDHVSDTQAQHDAAIELMRQRNQETDMRKRGFSENYAQALRDIAHAGYSPR